MVTLFISVSSILLLAVYTYLGFSIDMEKVIKDTIRMFKSDTEDI